MTTTVERLSDLAVGTVESVAADEIQILLDTTAPRSIALNAGVPAGFPRINGYILIPNESGSLIGLIARLWIERTPMPRSGPKDLINLPFPLRKLSVTPVGTLVRKSDNTSPRSYNFSFKRGVTVFPSVGDNVHLPTAAQLQAIIESETHSRRVAIGTSPLLANAEISLDPDRLFGGHLAVLGNTGSGKSCSVAGLVRWSIGAAAAYERKDGHKIEIPNARFIILDPNGEYKNSFVDIPGGVRVYQIPPPEPGSKSLTVPAWMWNTSEWCAFSSAAPSIQRPLLQQTLRALRAANSIDDSPNQDIRRRMQFLLSQVNERLASAGESYGKLGPARGVADLLKTLSDDALRYMDSTVGELKVTLFDLVTKANTMRDTHRFHGRGGEGYNPFSETEMLDLQSAIISVLELVPGQDEKLQAPEDAPIPFDVNGLADYLEQVAAHASPQAATLTAGLVVRIRNMLADSRLAGVISPEESPTFPEWLEHHIGSDGASNGPVTVLDLSLVPTEIIHLVVAVIGRVIFEALQRYVRSMGEELPTVLILEEAHTFVSRTHNEDISIPTASDMCRGTFERIAREGRKFGLGLVISSQRPSEISPTVLSQCNTFLLHRLVNDRDQDLVGRLVPDTLGGLLRELPSLPAKHAVIVGHATPLPLLVEMKELQFEHRPRSANPRFWDTWVGTKYKPINWAALAAEWEG
jgi:hypothetical protein